MILGVYEVLQMFENSHRNGEAQPVTTSQVMFYMYKKYFLMEKAACRPLFIGLLLNERLEVLGLNEGLTRAYARDNHLRGFSY